MTDFNKHDSIRKYKLLPNESSVKLVVRVISNEFTHNVFINNLMLLHDYTPAGRNSNFDIIIKQLRRSNTQELILFHDKILDKLFQIITQTRCPKN